jgi:hypothetical protein
MARFGALFLQRKKEEKEMPRTSNRGRSGRSDPSLFSGWTDTAKDKPLASAAVAAAAVGAGLFLWSKRNQISNQLSDLSDQISDWTESMRTGPQNEFEKAGAGMPGSMSSSSTGVTGKTGATGTSSRTSRATGSRPTSTGGRTARTSRGMSETGGGNASLGRHSGSGASSDNL